MLTAPNAWEPLRARIADDRRPGLQGRQAPQPHAPEPAGDGGASQTWPLGDLGGGHTVIATKTRGGIPPLLTDPPALWRASHL